MAMYSPFATLFTVLSVLFVGAATAQAQQPGKLDLEMAELQVLQLIGTRVFAGADQVGVVSDVSLSDRGLIDRIRLQTASPLGFGERIVEIHAPAFTLLGDTIVLDLSAAEVDQMPSVSESIERAQDAAEK